MQNTASIASSATIIISPYPHLRQVLAQPHITHVVSILGQSDKLAWPETGARETLRLAFDDTYNSSAAWIAPARGHVVELIEFSRSWHRSGGSICIHCRAGSSRSPAAALVVAAALNGSVSNLLVERIATAKSYFRPHKGMLALADAELNCKFSLVALVRSLPPGRPMDTWGPAIIPVDRAPVASD